MAAHSGWVRGVACTSSKVVSVGVDKVIKIWDGDEFADNPSLTEIAGNAPFTAVDCSKDDKHYATSSGVVDYWDLEKSDPIRTWKWGHDTFNRSGSYFLINF